MGVNWMPGSGLTMLRTNTACCSEGDTAEVAVMMVLAACSAVAEPGTVIWVVTFTNCPTGTVSGPGQMTPHPKSLAQAKV
ncbi:MAG: hypothetical protein BroJett015_01940 [Chloroflexota bacterium]|nr:MAG: hypothetical protein BroJett015_01940 [Chloroflexota bacterium]